MSPVILYSLMFAASSHIEGLRMRASHRDRESNRRAGLEQLERKGDAIHAINMALTDESFRESDELIHSILILAVNETRDDEEPADVSVAKYTHSYPPLISTSRMGVF